MVTIKEISEFPLIQMVFIGIILYLVSLGIRTIKAWLRLWEIKAINEEHKLTKQDPELKKLVEIRLGQSELTKQIEKSLKFENGEQKSKQKVNANTVQ